MKLRQDRKALSLELLTKHQQRVKDMIARIEKYKPTHPVNKDYNKLRRERIENRMKIREKESDSLLQQNIKLIYKIQTTGPKVSTKKFPEVKSNPKRLKSLSLSSQASTSKVSHNKFRIKDVYRNEEELFQENIKLITDIECTGPKIKCWLPRKIKNMNDLARSRKKEEEKKIIDKFKEISREFTRLDRMRSFRRRSSSGSLGSGRSEGKGRDI